MQQLLNSYKNYLQVSKGFMDVTIHGYAGTIGRVFRKLDTISPTHQQLREFVGDLYKKNSSYSHIANTCLAIEAYSEFAKNWIKFGRPRKPKQIIKDYLTEAEISLMVLFTKNIREKAMLAVLAYTGIRNNELCHLKVCDVDFGNNTLRVIAGKGRKDRVIPLAHTCVKILVEYLNAYPRGADDWLFTTLRKQNQYRTGDVRKLVKVVCRRFGIKKRVYPHLIRHSFAINLLKNRASIFLVQKLLGHEFIETTMIYLRSITVVDMQAEYHACVPNYA